MFGCEHRIALRATEAKSMEDGDEPDDDGLEAHLPNATQVNVRHPAMQYAMERFKFFRQQNAGQIVAIEHPAPNPLLFSKGDRADFALLEVMLVHWDPEKQFAHMNLLHCFSCIRCNGKVVKDGWSVPRRVYGLTRTKLVSARKYRCPCCPDAVNGPGKAVSFDAKHPVVMGRLPPNVADLLSVKFTHSGAMDTEML